LELPPSQTIVPSGQGGSPVELLLASVVELVLGSPEVLVAVVPLVVWSVVVPGPVVAVTGPVLASPELELEPGSLVGEPLVVGVPVDPGPVVPASVPLPVLAAALVLAEPSVVALSSPQALTSRAGSSRARGGRAVSMRRTMSPGRARSRAPPLRTRRVARVVSYSRSNGGTLRSLRSRGSHDRPNALHAL
jgi:hypothetical protein